MGLFYSLAANALNIKPSKAKMRISVRIIDDNQRKNSISGLKSEKASRPYSNVWWIVTAIMENLMNGALAE
jgi:hypothetical protein